MPEHVAIGTTVFALVIYLIACLVTDLLVQSRYLWLGRCSPEASGSASLAKEFPGGVSTATPAETPDSDWRGDDDDLDDAPILAWFVPSGLDECQAARFGLAGVAGRRLSTSASPIDAALWRGPRSFPLASSAMSTSTVGLSSARAPRTSGSVLATLLLLEGILAPIVLIIVVHSGDDHRSSGCGADRAGASSSARVHRRCVTRAPHTAKAS